MKKIIILFVLVLGFVVESWAQFPASPDLHFYIYVGSDCTNGEYNTDIEEVIAVKFFNNAIKVKEVNLTSLKFKKHLYLNEFSKSFDSPSSHDVYEYKPLEDGQVTHFGGDEYKYTDDGGYYVYYWHISKNKQQIVLWKTLKHETIERIFRLGLDWPDFSGGDFYYQQVSQEDLLNISLSSNNTIKIPNQVSNYNSNNQASNYNYNSNSMISHTINNNNSVDEVIDNYNKNKATGTWVTKQCSACKGTGKSSVKKYAPYMGGTRKQEYCAVCGGISDSHYHDQCSICKGTGQVKDYVY